MAVRPSPRVNNEFKGEKEMGERSSTWEGQTEAASGELNSKKENKPEVIVIKDDDDTSSSDDPDAVGVTDLQFGRRAQPLRYSKATRYHMLLEIALERKRQRQESRSSSSKPNSTNAAKSTPKEKGSRKEERDQKRNCCALLFAKDPFASSSDESDPEWDPTAVYGAAARRRLKGRYSETESETSADASEGEHGDEKDGSEDSAMASQNDSGEKGSCDNREIRGRKTSETAKSNAKKQPDTKTEESENSGLAADGEIAEQKGSNRQKTMEAETTTKQRTASAKTEALLDASSSTRSDASARRRRQAPLDATGSRTSKSTCDSAEVNSRKQKGAQEEMTVEQATSRKRE